VSRNLILFLSGRYLGICLVNLYACTVIATAGNSNHPGIQPFFFSKKSNVVDRTAVR
jgi:hypothetical protein